jgi:hypothetical protein
MAQPSMQFNSTAKQRDKLLKKRVEIWRSSTDIAFFKLKTAPI